MGNFVTSSCLTNENQNFLLNIIFRNAVATEIGNDIKDLETSDEIKDAVYTLVKQWIGTKITDFNDLKIHLSEGSLATIKYTRNI